MKKYKDFKGHKREFKFTKKVYLEDLRIYFYSKRAGFHSGTVNFQFHRLGRLKFLGIIRNSKIKFKNVCNIPVY